MPSRSVWNKLLGLPKVANNLNGVTLSFAVSALKVALDARKRGCNYSLTVHKGIWRFRLAGKANKARRCLAEPKKLALENLSEASPRQ